MDNTYGIHGIHDLFHQEHTFLALFFVILEFFKRAIFSSFTSIANSEPLLHTLNTTIIACVIGALLVIVSLFMLCFMVVLLFSKCAEQSLFFIQHVAQH